MSGPELLIVGTLVCVSFTTVLAVLIRAAILDGRYDREQRQPEHAPMIPAVQPVLAQTGVRSSPLTAGRTSPMGWLRLGGSGRARRLITLGAVGLGAAVAACGPFVLVQSGGKLETADPITARAAEPQQPQVVRVSATEFKFDQTRLQVSPGQQVQLTLSNHGSIEHNLYIQATGTRLVASAGKVVKGTFTLGQPGEYEFVCSIPGHKEAGMQGKLVVGTPASTTDARTAPPLASTPPIAASEVRPIPPGVARLPQPTVAPPVNRSEPALVRLDLQTQEVTALMDDGVAYRYWTFNGTIPGPMLRVRQGDMVELTLRNSNDSQVTHSINLHAVTGPGGGSQASQVAPGEQSTFRFQALHPGVYVYHCMTPMIGNHVAKGMYGLIVVEPPEGFSKVDQEYYLMQGDFYLQGDRAQQGLRDFSLEKLMDERPDYVVFNGAVGSIADERSLVARVGETVRIFFGVGGPNLDSSLHVVGETFDRVHPEGASEILTNVQTTLIPPGGATMVELKLEVPGMYMIEDHHITRIAKGAAAFLHVEGDANPAIFQPVSSGASE